jgi:internalin A
MKRFLLYIGLILGTSNYLFAQLTFVPDTNFRKLLVSRYSFYLDGNGNIVDGKAATYTGSIDCSFQKINDLTGISKFSGLVSLACQFNTISNLDSLGKLTKLTTLYAQYNNLTTLPNLSALSKLSYLSCGNNQMTSLPDLSSNVPLSYLDFSNNQIRSVKGLDKLVNLQTLYALENKLDSLPDLSNLTKMQFFMCHGNNLKALKGIDRMTQLILLYIGNNKFESLPDLTNLTNLSVFLAWNCGLTTAPNVSKMRNLSQLGLDENKLKSVPDFNSNTNLSVLKLNNNLISKMPDFSASKNTMRVLKLNNNQFDSLPDFSIFSTLDSVLVQNNRLTFEDLFSLVQNARITYKNYSPQDSVGTKQKISVGESEIIRIVLGIDKNVKTNLYKWYKNGKLYKTTTTDTLLISKVSLADTGIYSCQVSNSLAPMLTLNSRVIYLDIKPCIELSQLTYLTTDFDCNLGGTVNINELTIKGGQPPYTYKLVSDEIGSVRFANGNVFSNLFENSYKLEVNDTKGCKVQFEKPITLKGKRGIDCKRLVIYGEDNSPNNTLFFEERGSAKVYNKEGQLVQTFNTPNSWDGRNKNGEFLPGYYVIDLNGSILNVTLVK